MEKLARKRIDNECEVINLILENALLRIELKSKYSFKRFIKYLICRK